ncbi:antA/AntB antirepressor family protein [Laribacter hongkongensis]|uniref:antA/AntB antirepressor family protein n=1 Tax=Laribacter hongkongensis TaxID=168471 RepID=UPI001EFC5FB9|nr:antA/AntB antirepressor family protein [Laribacter hongkongensis]MCG8994566.1 antA/AntB antirepressor family protein [Laribacter hongkongensis]MCG9009219.1 antA/AntB antirepressor family protein [Laribacter hongkongensis]MCG9021834.1 antA/AntB antirepressor family protein [Laribacter hongkongensis]MCG9045563.1 antA/AntB antirepressor family protein [Laribacter hongkongensis]MCG9073032.1 antA/AntB antirepressor family protein [Laribacter hongkongensis]
MSKAKRTGKSLVITPNDCPKAELVTLGFTEDQAQRMMNTRRVLPIVDNRKAPCMDARKLWERIGKPHGRFDKWVEYHIKPLTIHDNGFAEISAKVTKGETGRPRTDYTLSRDIAAHLAMMANTPEGRDVRDYFLDMEDLAIRLAKRLPVRVATLVSTDNELTHHCIKKAAEAAKRGDIRRDLTFVVANDWEKTIKSLVCEVLSGFPAGHWREALGGGRGIRDVLTTDDLVLYSRCYDVAASLFRAGYTDREVLKVALQASFGGRINAADYGLGVEEAA